MLPAALILWARSRTRVRSPAATALSSSSRPWLALVTNVWHSRRTNTVSPENLACNVIKSTGSPACPPTAEAAAAFQQTLERFGFATSKAALGDPVDLGRRAALLAVADRIWRRQIGPLLDGRDVQRLLKVGTRQAVSDLVKRRGVRSSSVNEKRSSFEIGTC